MYYLGPDTQATQLLEHIESGNFGSEEEIAERMFPGHAQSSSKYRQTKHALTQKLESLVLFLNFNPKDNGELTAIGYKAERDVFIINTLRGWGLYSIAEKMARRTLNQIKGYDLTPLELSCYRTLQHAANLRIDPNEFEHYTKLIYAADELNRVETEFTTWRLRLTLARASQASLLPEDLSPFIDILAELELKRRRFPSRMILESHTKIASAVQKLSGNYEDAKNVIEEFVTIAEEDKRFSAKARMSTYFADLGELQLLLHRYGEANEALDKAVSIITTGNHNWFSCQLLIIIICLHMREYKRGAKHFVSIVQHPSFGTLRSQVSLVEKVRLLEGLLRVMTSSAPVLEPEETVDGATFSFDSLVEELKTPSFYRLWVNIVNLQIQTLHFLQRREFDLVELRTKALDNQLRRSNLDKESYKQLYRVRLLVKMLKVMIICDYKYLTTRDEAESAYQRLTSNTHNPNAEDESKVVFYEVMPYQHLWDAILQELKQIQAERLIIRPKS